MSGQSRAGGVAMLVSLAGCAVEGSPSALDPAGAPAARISALGWWVTGVMVAIVLVSCALYLAGARGWGGTHTVPEGERRGVRWVLIGGAIVPAVILVTLYGFTLAAMRGVSEPPESPGWTIRITGYQWWWKAEYENAAGDVRFVTANEIHLPVGDPVAIELASADVIHSFWVPRLAGKTDLVPGRVNHAWLEADRPGVYRGQCAEFCGRSHALMRLLVVAEEPEAFRRWTERMGRAPAVGSAGIEVFSESGCAACHRIAGTLAQGRVGPDLSHVGSRRTLAAGLFENTTENRADWLRSPDSLKPGARMPDLDLARDELAVLVDFLGSLE